MNEDWKVVIVGLTNLAKFTSQLIKEGVTFKVTPDCMTEENDIFTVKFTGGY